MGTLAHGNARRRQAWSAGASVLWAAAASLGVIVLGAAFGIHSRNARAVRGRADNAPQHFWRWDGGEAVRPGPGITVRFGERRLPSFWTWEQLGVFHYAFPGIADAVRFESGGVVGRKAVPLLLHVWLKTVVHASGDFEVRTL